MKSPVKRSSRMNKRLMIPVAAATALAASALTACGGQLAATSTAATAQTSSATSESMSSVTTESTVAALETTGYTDGTYQGSAISIRWGDVQVQVSIQDGKISDVEFLTYPTDPRSLQINRQAAPLLAKEAIESQSADVQVISGATFTSLAFMESLSSALSQA
jgi:uncharacterized protein with FMN-binding domain